MGDGSLPAWRARSYEQARVVLAIAGCTSAQSIEKALPPFSKTTVGDPGPSS
jgi:hypothetical protein